MSKITLGEAIAIFLSRYRASSAASYKSQLVSLGNDYLSFKRPLESISPLELIKFMASVEARPEVNSPATYNKYVKTLRTFFNWAVKTQLIETSPATALSKRPTRASVPKSKAMTETALNKLLSFYTKWLEVNDDPRPLALIQFLADTGCRIGGAADLTRDRLQLDQPVSIIEGEQLYQVELFEKGRPDPNLYYFSQSTARVLSDWLTHHDGPHVFSVDGRFSNANTLARRFRKWCIRAGAGSWGPHSLRHRKAHIAAQNLPLSIAARLLNDTETVFLQYYAPKDTNYIRAGAAELLSIREP